MNASSSRFRVLRRLGAGGMGVVELVEDAQGRRFARKRMHGADASDDAHLAFRREFHTLATLRHPAIVEAREFGVDGDSVWYTMEYLEGEDLHSLGAVPWRQACEILRDVASALSLLHGRRLIHRDIKPGNIRLDQRGHAHLIDFGVMTSFGASTNIAGTPGYMPPESVAGLALDQAVDLYGLGALGYWLLTGTNAIHASTLQELTSAWGRPIAAPSSLCPGVPAGLDDLILGLLARNPLARPASAAEVTERLTAIANLEPVAAQQPATWTLASTVLAGREREVQLIEKVIAARGDGMPVTVLFSGPSGMGKSRLLREAVLRAQIAGATAVEVRCSLELGNTRPYATLATVAEVLLRRHPEPTLAAARPVAEDLGFVLPELAAAAGRDKSLVTRIDPNDARLRGIDAARAWLAELSQTLHPVVVVDDLQWCDEGSAAALARLQQDSDRPLLLFAALRTDVPSIAQGAVRALRDGGRVHRVRPLAKAEIHALAAGIFGDADHFDAAADWLHEASGGSPMLCIDLAHHLIDSGIARSVGGQWLLPGKWDEAGFPADLAEASDARVAKLAERPREVARAVAVLGKAAPIAVVHRLVDLSYEELFEALDELVARDLLGEDRAQLRITHDALREALLRSMDVSTLRTLHRRAAQALHVGSEVPQHMEATLGWHWLRGGEERRGADLLARAAQRYIADEAGAEALPLLRAALDVYERLGVDAAVQFRLRHQLILGGLVCDLPVILRHGLPALDQAWSLAGLDYGQRFARFLGRPLGFIVGMTLAAIRWVVTPPKRRVASPAQAMEVTSIALFGLAAVVTHCDDAQLAAQLRQRLEFLRGLRVGLLFAVARIADGFLLMGEWRPAAVQRASEEAYRAVLADRVTLIGDLERRALLATTRNMLPFISAFSMDPAMFESLAAARAFGLRTIEASHALAEAVYHHWRGELTQAKVALARFERDQTAIGRSWMWDAILGWSTLMGCAWNRDVLGLRRAIARQESLGLKLGRMEQDQLELARGEYHRERGDLNESRRILEALDRRVSDHGFVALATPVAYAETLLALGHLRGAQAAAVRGRARAACVETRSVPCEVRCLRALALIATAEGRHDEAQGYLREGHMLARRSNAPTLVGSLWEAEARIAHHREDHAAYLRACARVQAVYAGTENPTLIARGQRLAELDRVGAEEAGELAHTVVTLQVGCNPVTLLRSRIEAATSRTLRFCAALDALLELTEATKGYLYSYVGELPEVVAPEQGAEPPREVDEVLGAVRRPETDAGATTETQSGWWVVTFGRPSLLALVLHRPTLLEPELMDQMLSAVGELLGHSRASELPTEAQDRSQDASNSAAKLRVG